MPSHANLLLFFALIVAISVTGFILYRALSSRLRPFFIVGIAWKTAVLSPRANFKTFALALTMIAIGRALQRLFQTYSIFDETTLLILSVVWQAILNMSLAMIAVAIHLHTIEYVKSRFGLDDYELKKSLPQKLLMSALLGGVIWAIGWLTLSGARYLLHSTETNHPALFANTLTFILYVEASLLMLVRPAYTLEVASPWRAGIASAIKAAPSLLVIQACLSIPIIFYNIIFAHFAGLTPKSSLLTSIIGDAIFVAFSAIQFLAVEVSATMLMARLELSRFVFKKSYG